MTENKDGHGKTNEEAVKKHPDDESVNGGGQREKKGLK